MGRFLVAIVAGLLIAGCSAALRESHTPKKSETARPVFSFCELAKPMTWAVRDSLETQMQIRAYNARIRQQCGPEGSPDGK